MQKEYTITVYSENKVGILKEITTLFTRRQINIESLTTSESAIKGIHKFTIVIFSSLEQTKNLVKQIEKCIDVLRAYFFDADEITYQEIALYKVSTKALFEQTAIENIVRTYGARILEVTEEYTVIEKTGHKIETQQLYEKLEPYSLTQFTRSGRIAVNKLKKEPLNNYLRNLEEEKRNL